jgi:hypothetical protein
VGRWKQSQGEPADDPTIRRWFGNKQTAGVAAVCGTVSGGLLIFDFDEDGYYERWCEAFGKRASQLPTQRRGGGGYQVALRCNDPGKNQQLAWHVDEAQKEGRRVAIETRGEGGYAVLPPSRHPSGETYQTISGDFANVPSLSQEEANRLLDAARALCQAPRSSQRDENDRQAQRKSNTVGDNGGVIEQWNAARPVREMLRRVGYSEGPGGEMTRPGPDASPGGVVIFEDADPPRSYHHSTNDPLHNEHGHDAFSIFCELEHEGEVKAAVKAAARELGIAAPATSGQFTNADRARVSDAHAMAPSPPQSEYRPFPTEHLPEPVASFISNACEAVGCDPSFVALPLLSALASAIGNTRRIELKRGWSEPAILWTAIIGDSGTKKSPGMEVALQPIKERQRKAMRDHEEAKRQYDAQMKQYEKDLNQWKKKGQGEDPPAEPEPPVAERCWCDDATVEAVAVLLLNRWRGLLMVRDELAGWLGGFDRYAQNKGGDAAKWLEMHGGRSMMVDRKTSDTLYIPRAAVSITGGIQPEPLKRALGDEHRENGLAARLLLAMPPRKAKRWTEAEIDPDQENAIAAVFETLFGLAPDTDDDGESQPKLLKLTPGGKHAWVEFYNAHADEQAELRGDLAAAWSKLEGYAARLSLVVHLTRWAAGDSTLADTDAIDEHSVNAGVALSQWFGQEAKRIYAELWHGEKGRRTRELIKLIQRRGGSISASELVRSKRGIGDVGDAGFELDALANAGYGRWEQPPQRGPGRPPAERLVLTSDANGNPIQKPDTQNNVNEKGPELSGSDNFVDGDRKDGSDDPQSEPDDWGEL